MDFFWRADHAEDSLPIFSTICCIMIIITVISFIVIVFIVTFIVIVLIQSVNVFSLKVSPVVERQRSTLVRGVLQLNREVTMIVLLSRSEYI